MVQVAREADFRSTYTETSLVELPSRYAHLPQMTVDLAVYLVPIQSLCALLEGPSSTFSVCTGGFAEWVRSAQGAVPTGSIESRSYYAHTSHVGSAPLRVIS